MPGRPLRDEASFRETRYNDPVMARRRAVLRETVALLADGGRARLHALAAANLARWAAEALASGESASKPTGAAQRLERGRSEAEAERVRLPTDTRPHARPSHSVWELLPIGSVIRARKIQMVQGSAVFALEAASLAVEQHDRALFAQTSAAIQRDDAQIARAVEAATGLRIADATRTRWWQLARELSLIVPGQLRRDHRLGRLPKTLAGKPFAELPDFTEELTAVASAGFATGVHGGTCHMFAVRPAWATLEQLATA